MERLKPIPAEQVADNVFKLVGKDWMLITAGTPESWNTMTAGWGGLGALWNRPVAFVFIRPQRHTYGFVERAERFTLSFFDEKYREALNFCGTRSGREVNKAKATGLRPVFRDRETVYFEQARLVFVCRKVYARDIDPDLFLDPSIQSNYPKRDYHRMYIGEVVACLTE